MRVRNTILTGLIAAVQIFFLAASSQAAFGLKPHFTPIGQNSADIHQGYQSLEAQSQQVNQLFFNYDALGCTVVIRNLSCFVAGTLVHTANGRKPIEDIQVGDVVLGSDPEYDSPVTLSQVFDDPSENVYKVVATLRNTVPLVFELDFGGGIVTASPEHPFWIEGKGWVKVEDLTIGDVANTLSEQQFPVNYNIFI